MPRSRKTDNSRSGVLPTRLRWSGLLNVDVAMPRGVMGVLASVEQAAESRAMSVRRRQ